MPVEPRECRALRLELRLYPYKCSLDLSSPVERKYPPALGGTLSQAAGCTRTRLYRWLDESDENPLDWHELQAIAEEIG